MKTKINMKHISDNGSFPEEEKYLGFTISELDSLGGGYTAREISIQPKLWLDTHQKFLKEKNQIRAFLHRVFENSQLNIILTGAGSSAFIGNILHGIFQKNLKQRTWAVATTDLVSHPHLYFYSNIPTLLVSFARSGNSPESVAAVDQANLLTRNIYHLIITCNPTGKLATAISGDNSYVFLLPQEADDQSLAMTGSFSSMLLTGILVSHIDKLEGLQKQVEQMSDYGRNILDNYTEKIKGIANLEFQRAVFLGSGPLAGTARESHLKLQELTDGKIICKTDSFLGFRHGPKAVINPLTLMIYLFSNNEYVSQYEMDLVNAINEGEKGLFSIGISEKAKEGSLVDFNIVLSGEENCDKLEEEFLAVCSVLPAQILGFFKSIQMGLKPDSPSARGAISRVVQGVNIYPYSGTSQAV
jgi:tagatose-6-phosphate ketose/aldose isomerase